MAGSVAPDLPTIGTGRSVSDVKIRGSLITLRDALNAVLTSGNTLDGATLEAASVGSTALANAAVTNTKLATGVALGNLASASVTDAKLASPNNPAYKTVHEAAAGGVGFTVGTWVFREDGIAASPTNVATASIFNYVAADYAVSGLATKLRLRASLANNATAPAITFTVGLYPVTVAGASSIITYTFGTVVSGSAVALASPPASTVTSGDSGDFTPPADGVYIIAVVASGSAAAGSAEHISAHLQVRNV